MCYAMISLFSVNTADVWCNHKTRADGLRQHRDKLHPTLAAELAELERVGY